MPRHITISRLEYGIVSNWMRFIGIMQIWDIYNSFSLINLSWELWEHLPCAHAMVLSSPMWQQQISVFLPQLSAVVPRSSLLVLLPIYQCFSSLHWHNLFLRTWVFPPCSYGTYEWEEWYTSRLVWEWGGWDAEERRSWGLSPPISEPVQHFLP